MTYRKINTSNVNPKMDFEQVQSEIDADGR